MKHKKIFQFHSIRHRIMLIFMGLMAAMLLAIWGVNTWWLEGYYVDQKLKVMEQAYTDIDSAIQEKVGENENIGDVLREELEQEWDIWKQTAKGDTGSDSEEEPVPGQMRQNRLIRRMRSSRKICRKTFRKSGEPCLERSAPMASRTILRSSSLTVIPARHWSAPAVTATF